MFHCSNLNKQAYPLGFIAPPQPACFCDIGEVKIAFATKGSSAFSEMLDSICEVQYSTKKPQARYCHLKHKKHLNQQPTHVRWAPTPSEAAKPNNPWPDATLILGFAAVTYCTLLMAMKSLTAVAPDRAARNLKLVA